MIKSKTTIPILLGVILGANTPRNLTFQFHQINTRIRIQGLELFDFNFYINYPLIPLKTRLRFKSESEIKEILMNNRVTNNNLLFSYIVAFKKDSSHMLLSDMFSILIENKNIVYRLNNAIYDMIFKKELSFVEKIPTLSKTKVQYKHSTKIDILIDLQKTDELKSLAQKFMEYLEAPVENKLRELHVILALEYRGLFDSNQLDERDEDLILNLLDEFCVGIGSVELKEIKSKTVHVSDDDYSLFKDLPIREQFNVLRDECVGDAKFKKRLSNTRKSTTVSEDELNLCDLD